MIVWLCISKSIIRRIARRMIVMCRALGLMLSTRANIGGTNGFKAARLPTLNGASERRRIWRNCRFIIDDMTLVQEMLHFVYWMNILKYVKWLKNFFEYFVI